MSVKEEITQEILTFCKTEKINKVSRETVNDFVESYADQCFEEMSDAVVEKLQDHHDIEVVD